MGCIPGDVDPGPDRIEDRGPDPLGMFFWEVSWRKLRKFAQLENKWTMKTGQSGVQQSGLFRVVFRGMVFPGGSLRNRKKGCQ